MSVTNTPTIESRTRPRETAAQLLSVEEARARVVAAMPLLESEPVDLKHARGRVTAEDVRAGRDHPAAAISAMDGYALRLADVTQLPVRLRKIGVSRAGARFDSPLLPGCCVRIFTGATVPAGADTIALQEDASEDGQEVESRDQERWEGEPAHPCRRPGFRRGPGLRRSRPCSNGARYRRHRVLRIYASHRAPHAARRGSVDRGRVR